MGNGSREYLNKSRVEKGEIKLLFGEFFNQMDAKGRIRIPGKIKAGLGENPMVTKGTNGCLFLFSQDELRTTIYDKISAVPLSDLNVANALRALFSGAQELEEDNQGRTMVPQNLRAFAKLQKDIVIIGVGNRAEIWSRESYDKQFDNIDFDTALSTLKDYGV